MMLNIIYNWENDIYRFDWVLAILVVATWLRLLFSLRISKRFGPLFKIIQAMVLNLTKFLIIWIMVIFIFSAFTTLMLNDRFSSLGETLIYFFKASMGEYDYEDFGSDIYLLVFLFVNMVIMLNFIIAIMVATF